MQAKEKNKQHNYNKNKKKTGPKKEADPDDLTHILKNYRDRAKERRVGEDTQQDSVDDMMKLQGGYHAVAPANIRFGRMNNYFIFVIQWIPCNRSEKTGD